MTIFGAETDATLAKAAAMKRDLVSCHKDGNDTVNESISSALTPVNAKKREVWRDEIHSQGKKR